MIPFIGKPFQAIENLIPVGRDKVGSGIFDAEHRLIRFQTNLRRVADGLAQNSGFIAGDYFPAVDYQAGKDDIIRFRGKMQFLFPKRNHSLNTAEEYFSIMCHEQRILIDSSQRESVFRTVIIELLMRIVEL